MTRLTIDLPDDVVETLRASARADGYQSLAECARQTLCSMYGVSIPRRTWGRSKDTQLKAKDTHLKPKVTQLNQRTSVQVPIQKLARQFSNPFAADIAVRPTVTDGELTYEDITD